MPAMGRSEKELYCFIRMNVSYDVEDEPVGDDKVEGLNVNENETACDEQKEVELYFRQCFEFDDATVFFKVDSEKGVHAELIYPIVYLNR